MERTIKIRLHPTPEQERAFENTVKQFTASFNAVCSTGWRMHEGNAYTLHHLTYRDCKEANPDLVSDLHVQARQKAAEAVKSAIALEKQGRKVSCPNAQACPPRYNLHTFTLDWEKGIANLSTVAGRQKMFFSVPRYTRYAIGQATATADLIRKKGKWILHVVVKLPAPEFADNGQALGVDLGVTRPAVTSDNRFHGKRQWRNVVKRTFRLRRRLQTNGSKSAKRHLRRLAGRTQRFRRDCDHVLSKRILEGVTPGTTIVVENLTNIRRRVKARRGEAKRRLHAWSFAQLRSFLEYKAEALGCRVKSVDPRHTSQRCNVCGYTYRGNRRSQSEFQCRQCGHRDNADRNASKNIRDKHLALWGSAVESGPPSTGLSSQPSG